MSINPNIGGNGGNVGVGGAPQVQGAPPEATPPITDDTFVSTLSQSQLEALILNLMASYPIPGAFPLASLFSANGGNFSKMEVDAFLLSMGQKKEQIVNDMLTAWVESVQKQAAIQAHEATKTEQQNQIQQSDRLQHARLKEDVDNTAAAPIQYSPHVTDAAAYLDYLASLSTPRRAEEVGTVANQIADNYISNTPALQDSDIAKAVLPLLVMETLVINPAVQQVMVMPGTQLSDQIGVNPIADQVQPAMNQIPTVFQDQTLLTINLFVMDMVKNATVDMYLKQGGNSPVKPTDIEFAKTFASQMLEKVRTPGFIEGELIKNSTGAEFLNGEQLQVAGALVKAFAMLNAVMLFTKVEGGTLQENELKEMLNGETDIPTADNRGELLEELRSILDSIPAQNQVDFATTLLKYVGTMPDTDRLTNWIHALNAAMEEITPAQRAVQTASD